MSETITEPVTLWGAFEFFPETLETEIFEVPVDAFVWKPHEYGCHSVLPDDEMDVYFATKEERDLMLAEKPEGWFPIETQTTGFGVGPKRVSETFHGIRFVPERFRNGIPDSFMKEAVLKIYGNERILGMSKKEFLAEFRDVWQGGASSLWFFDKPMTSFRHEARPSGLQIGFWIGCATGPMTSVERKIKWDEVYRTAFAPIDS